MSEYDHTHLQVPHGDGKCTKRPTEAKSGGHRGLHQPAPDGPRAHNLLEGDVSPRDIYVHPEYVADLRAPGNLGQANRESVKAIMAIRGKPNALVTVYRAVPPGVDTINEGDWVSFSRQYAELHARQNDDPLKDWPVISQTVRAREVVWAGDDLNEFGYYPQACTCHDSKGDSDE